MFAFPRSLSFLRFVKMSGKAALERVKQNAEAMKKNVDDIKNELKIIDEQYNIILIKQLQEENAQLVAAVEAAKKKLIRLEEENGIKQVPLPNRNVTLATSVEEPPEAIKEKPVELAKETQAKEKPKKEKKEKKPKEPKETSSEAPIDVGRLDLRIGKVVDVQRHPDADTLYVLKINCGEDNPRTVCSGLVKHVPIEELRDRSVVLLCNLKPVKMRGIMSEAMVMCASSESGVEVLTPPESSQPGDLVECRGFTRQPDAVMNPKKKIFETVAPDLHTNQRLQACYKDVPFEVPGKGFCLAKSLKDVPVK